MVAEDSSLLHSSTEECTELQDSFEAEETLSLCDLPIHNDSFKWEEDFSGKFEQSYSLDEDNNMFEFFSEDFTASTYPSRKELIFCGKLFPYKAELPAPEKTQNFKIDKKQSRSSTRTKKRLRFHWKYFSLNKLVKHYSPYSVKESNNKSSESEALPNSKNNTKKCAAFSVENKVSLLASPTKSRWHLFMFGIGKLPTEMELKNIKLRQSKRFPSPMFSSSFDSSSATTTQRRSEKGLWRLLRALGYRSQHINAVTMTL